MTEPRPFNLAIDAHGFPVLLDPHHRPTDELDPPDDSVAACGDASPGQRVRRLLASSGRRSREDERPAGSKTLAGVAAHLGLTPDQVEEYARFGQSVLTAKCSMTAAVADAAENVTERAPEDRA